MKNKKQKSENFWKFSYIINYMKKEQLIELKKSINSVESAEDIHTLSYAIENVANDLWEYSNEENGELVDKLNDLWNDMDDYISEHEHDEYWEEEHNCSAISKEVVDKFRLRANNIIEDIIW